MSTESVGLHDEGGARVLATAAPPVPGEGGAGTEEEVGEWASEGAGVAGGTGGNGAGRAQVGEIDTAVA